MRTRLLSLLFLVGLAAGQSFAAEDGWMENYEKALARAKKENKAVLMDFTGSDWCGGCILLKKKVFSKPAFQDYAEKNLVLLKIDFPMQKPQPRDIRKQNEMLQNKFGVIGFPTLIVLDPKGKPLAEFYYRGEGPDDFIATVEKIRTSR